MFYNLKRSHLWVIYEPEFGFLFGLNSDVSRSFEDKESVRMLESLVRSYGLYWEIMCLWRKLGMTQLSWGFVRCLLATLASLVHLSPPLCFPSSICHRLFPFWLACFPPLKSRLSAACPHSTYLGITFFPSIGMDFPMILI